MKTQLEKNDSYFRAKEKVQKVKRFYIHLIVYIILVILLVSNYLILEEDNQFFDLFILSNSIVVIVWAIIIGLHAWIVFKGRLFFKQSWEDKKLKEYLDNNNNTTNLWE